MSNTNYKLTAFLSIALIVGTQVHSQSAITANKKFEKLYFQFGGAQTGKGDHYTGFEASMQAFFYRNWTATVSFHKLNVKPSNLPKNYQPSYDYTFFFFIPLETNEGDPSVRLNLLSLTAGKKLILGRRAWITPEAGISLGMGEKASFRPQQVVTIDYNYLLVGEYSQTSNYEEKRSSQFAAGLMLRTDLSFAITRFLGVSWGAFVNFNSANTALGYNFKLLVGNMGIKKKK